MNQKKLLLGYDEMKVLVTGATGFVGHALLELLNQHDVACVGRKRPDVLLDKMTWVEADILNLDLAAQRAIESFSPECCIHLAWDGLPDYSLEKCQLNLNASVNLFHLLRNIGCKKVISAGTCWEYGELTGRLSESRIGYGLNIFAAHKIALREIGQSIFAGLDCFFIWARLFFVYGAKQRATSLIPMTYFSMKRGDVPKIIAPMAVNDFVHVHDVASALLCLLEYDNASDTYNIGSGYPNSVAEVVNEVAYRTGIERPYPELVTCFDKGFWADIDRMTSIGWRPSQTIHSGVAQVVSELDAKHAI